MTDFQSRLEALAQKKADAEAEKQRLEDEARARNRKYMADMEALIQGAFERPLRELQEKSSSLGFTLTTDPFGHRLGLVIQALPTTGPKISSSLMVLPRGEDAGIEVIFSLSSKPSKNTKVQPHQVTEEWAEKVLLSFVEAFLDL